MLKPVGVFCASFAAPRVVAVARSSSSWTMPGTITPAGISIGANYATSKNNGSGLHETLAGVDALLVTEVYAAGEAPIKGADGRAICRAVRSRGKVEPIFVGKLEEIAAALRTVIVAGDVVVTMGAGHIGAIAQELPARLNGGGGA